MAIVVLKTAQLMWVLGEAGSDVQVPRYPQRVQQGRLTLHLVQAPSYSTLCVHYCIVTLCQSHAKFCAIHMHNCAA